MCNCKGRCGCNITQITKGEKGDNGTNGANGANAFKFVKEFETEDIEQTITVPYSEWTDCGVINTGCLADGTTANPFVDVHIQLWLFVPSEIGSSYWQLLVNGPPAENFSYTTRIDSASGDITIITDGNLGNYRLVILA
jgi:hypothetical protein